MSRKDTIIVAVLVNVTLLALLFATASRWEESLPLPTQLPAPAPAVAVAAVARPPQSKLPVDEVDVVLQEYAMKRDILAKPAPPKRSAPPKPKATDAAYYVIKPGDNPWKIARKYHLDVDALLALNGLDAETAKRLKPGQQIRIK